MDSPLGLFLHYLICLLNTEAFKKPLIHRSIASVLFQLIQASRSMKCSYAYSRQLCMQETPRHSTHDLYTWNEEPQCKNFTCITYSCRKRPKQQKLFATTVTLPNLNEYSTLEKFYTMQNLKRKSHFSIFLGLQSNF